MPLGSIEGANRPQDDVASLRGGRTRTAEADELNVSCLVEEHMLSPNLPVRHAVRVAVGDGAGQLREEHHGLWQIE